MKEFSTFIGAVKKNERTDQYLILGVMYSLGAYIKPVTANEISKILKLHLGSNKPSNVNASLRKYTGLVSPIQEGPPILWSLTSEGVIRLRTLSGLPLISEISSQQFDSDIGIVCALDFPEFAAVINAFNENPWTEIHDPRYTHVYQETNIITKSRESLRVI